MSVFKAGWYLIYTRPNQERKVSHQLMERDVVTYLPLMKEKRKWSDRIKIIIAPIFPSYVFVYVKTSLEFYESVNVAGACGFVKFANEPARISESQIEHVRLMEQGGENIEVSDSYFYPGQQLVINHGPLNGLTCEVVQYKGKKRLLVRIDILKRNILADLPSTAVTQCHQQKASTQI